MASGGPALQQEALSLQARVKTLINHDLKEICRGEHLPVSGVKAQLQSRIIDLLTQCVQLGDVERLNRLRHRIHNHGATPPSGASAAASATPGAHLTHSSPHARTSYNMANGYGNGSGRPAAPQYLPPARQPAYTIRFHFKPSPFYEILEALTSTLEMQKMPDHRANHSLTLSLSAENAERLKADTSLRIMLYCAAEPVMGPFGKNDVTFPQQLEIKVNNDEVKANFKGLKNKPGSTRPADITDLVRKLPSYRNHISVTFALTQKKFSLVAILVRKHTVEELTERIKKARVITKQRVISDMISKANDPDIVATSTVMSLKDPISTLRINTPCRSNVCNHNQCFDIESFLQLQEQAPTWTCPVCNKSVAFEGLAVDQYVQEILQATSKSTDQVTIEPDGRWSHNIQAETSSSQNGVSKDSKQYDDDSDDLIEISDYRVSAIKNEVSTTPCSMARTPPLSSRETSTTGSGVAPRSAGTKRAAAIIDLTLSDDEEPARPAKKPAYSTPSSLPDSIRNEYRQPSIPNNTRPSNGIAPFRIGQQHSRPGLPPESGSPHRPLSLPYPQPQPQPQSQPPPPPPPPQQQRNVPVGYMQTAFPGYGSGSSP